MTDGLDQELANAGLDLLRADPDLTVFDGAVANPTPDIKSDPWVLVYTTISWPTGAPGDALDGLSGSPTVRWICHCVGGNAEAARAVAQRVRTQLLNQRPVIAGLDLGMIRFEQGDPPGRNEMTGELVMDAVVIYRLNANT